MGQEQFRVRFCELFESPDSEFEKPALSKCLYLHARCLSPVLRRVAPELFERGPEMIRHPGQTSELRDATQETHSFQDENASRRDFMRTTLRLRACGRKASGLPRRVFWGCSEQQIFHGRVVALA